MDQKLFRQIPQVGELVASPAFAGLRENWAQGELVLVLRGLFDQLRADLKDGHPLPDFESDGFIGRVAEELEAQKRLNLRRVINGTGIIIHTNLGRAPLAPSAIEAMQDVAQGYANIEYDLEAGKRGSRYDHIREILCALTGAEDAVVVNNCAAAVTIAMATFARDREVIVSRGELVEIGGSFRVPDVISQNGARLREVGTTNKTHLADYERAIGDHTAVLLRTHTSNYRLVGFTAKPPLADLAALAHERGLLFVEDLGSGTIIDLAAHGIGDEPTVSHSIKSGVDLVTFSGDKLLGGPQCGLMVGKKALIAQIRKNPLLRAMRVDKLSLAALEATLRLYRSPHDPLQDVPVLRMLTAKREDLAPQAEKLADQINSIDGATAEVRDVASEAGGGSLPGVKLDSVCVAIRVGDMPAREIIAQLRAQEPAIIGRINDDRAILDVRTLMDSDLPEITAAVAAIAKSS
ncbi:MAG: L-seryl-tRNA(Sec) selenium transferase [Alphaproteobacteria bacterium]